MKTSVKLKSVILSAILACLAMPSFLYAGEAINPQQEFQKSLEKGGIIESQSRPIIPEIVVGRVINLVLTYIGVAILALVIYAGVLWATARGNDQQIAKAKQILLGAIIGLIIIFTAAGVVNFVISRLGAALTL